MTLDTSHERVGTKWRDEREQTLARIDRLEHVLELDPLPWPPVDPPPPPPFAPMIGASVPPKPTLPQSWIDYMATIGTDTTARRSFDDWNPPSSFADTKASIDVGHRESHWSCKPGPGSVAAGTHDAAFTSLFASKPAGHPLFLTSNHECDNPAKHIDPEHQVADLIRLADLRDASPDAAAIQVGICMMRFTFDNDEDHLWLPDRLLERLDFIAVDCYQQRASARKPWRERASSFDDKVQVTYGKPLKVWEHGHPEDPDTPGDHEAKIAWFADQHAWAVERKVETLLHFNNAGGVISKGEDYLVTSSPEVTAEFVRQVELSLAA